MNRPRFMTGFNAGSRHEKLQSIPSDFELSSYTADFQVGYHWGVKARREGLCTDNEAAGNANNAAWDLASRGAPVPL